MRQYCFREISEFRIAVFQISNLMIIDFITGCSKLISHDRVDLVTLRAWFDRNIMDQILDDIKYIDSRNFLSACNATERQRFETVKNVCNCSQIGMASMGVYSAKKFEFFLM